MRLARSDSLAPVILQNSEKESELNGDVLVLDS